MATAVVMPRQGQSVETCIITRWYKSKGEHVKEGDMLFSYETDKAAFEEEAKETGELLDIFYQEGDEVAVLENVAVIGKAGENYEKLIPSGVKKDLPDKAPGTAAGNKVTAGPEQGVTDNDPGADSGNEFDTGREQGAADYDPETAAGNRVAADREEKITASDENNDNERLRVSPLARRIAGELNVPLPGIKGTGPHGRIIERDVRQAASEKDKQADQSGDTVTTYSGDKTADRQEGNDFSVSKISNMRRIIAEKMSESLKNSAQLTHHMSADARGMLEWRNEIKEIKNSPGHIDITLNDMVCFAVIKALKKHPEINSHYLGDSMKLFNRVHLGIAVDTERGLMVPVLRNADDLNIDGLAKKIKALAADCKKGNVDPGLLDSGAASFTVTNLGAYGVEMFTPVLNLPQTGILGVNTITYRPADTGRGTIGFIPVIGLSLTYDHRAIDGAPASAFLREVKLEIESIRSGC